MSGKLVHSFYLLAHFVRLALAVKNIIVKLGIGKSEVVLVSSACKTVGGRLAREFLVKTELLRKRCAESQYLCAGKTSYGV